MMFEGYSRFQKPVSGQVVEYCLVSSNSTIASDLSAVFAVVLHCSSRIDVISVYSCNLALV